MSHMGDYNVKSDETAMIDFNEVCRMSYLFKSNTCYKKPWKLNCIDFILKNHPRLFLKSAVIEIRLFGFHKMNLVIKKTFCDTNNFCETFL